MKRAIALLLAAQTACATLPENATEDELEDSGSILHSFGAPLILGSVGAVVGGTVAIGLEAKNEVSVVPGAATVAFGTILAVIGGLLLSEGSSRFMRPGADEIATRPMLRDDRTGERSAPILKPTETSTPTQKRPARKVFKPQEANSWDE